jgi:pimeloyl-ACP methyl ester carboxylesterase
MAVKKITLDGIRLRYEEVGKGFPIIFLHGWGGSLQSFDALKKYFIPNYKVYILDLPGFGESATPFEAWDVERYKSFVLDFAEIHNLDQFIILGHSFGGRIIIKLVVDKPEKIKAAILCASAGIKPRKKLRQKLFFAIAKLGKKVFRLPVLNKGQNFARKILYKLVKTKDYLNVSGVMKDTFKKVIAEDLEPLLKKIKVPTLIAWGKNDRTTPLEDAYLMHKLVSDSKLVIIDEAKHGVHFQQPEKLAQAIQEFLSKV